MLLNAQYSNWHLLRIKIKLSNKLTNYYNWTIILKIYYILISIIGACNGPHEWFGCGSYCDVECGKIGEPCPIVNIKCTERCYCDPGYARDEYCNCVPFDDCDNC